MDEFLVHFCCRHPRGWCGLKSEDEARQYIEDGRHPRGWCGLKFRKPVSEPLNTACRPPRGWCGLKFLGPCRAGGQTGVATREGGVD